MSRPRPLVALVATAVLGALALAPPIAAAANKGGGVRVTKQVNQQVPDRADNTAPFGLLTSTIRVGKRFQGMKVRDVNVTMQTTGSAADAAEDMFVLLTAPNGATTVLFFSIAGQSVGPVTFDDEAPLYLDVPPAEDPTALYPPYIGSVEPFKALAVMDNGRVKGTWTLKVLDTANTNTNILNSWRLNVAVGRPFQTK